MDEISANPENIIMNLRNRLADEIVARAVTEAALWEAQQELTALKQKPPEET